MDLEQTMPDDRSVGILIVSHGSPRAEANAGFVTLVARIAARLGGDHVLPAFASLGRPDIPEQVALLASRGLRRIVVMPHFLSSGRHATIGIPSLLEECRQRFPQLAIELLPTLENDPGLEDLLLQRLLPHVFTVRGR